MVGAIGDRSIVTTVAVLVVLLNRPNADKLPDLIFAYPIMQAMMSNNAPIDPARGINTRFSILNGFLVGFTSISVLNRSVFFG